MRIKNPQARTWYANEAAEQVWSVRALDRQISTLFYERLLSSQDKDGVSTEAATLIAQQAPAKGEKLPFPARSRKIISR